jgi:hypothetical protein
MIMNNVKEKSVDKVIPYVKDKSASSDKKLLEQTINETLIRLEHYLKRIKKYSIRDFTSRYPDGLYEEDGSGVFDDFYISQREGRMFGSSHDKFGLVDIKLFKCRFYYHEDSKTLCFQYTKETRTRWHWSNLGEEQSEVLGFRKSKLKSIETIRRGAIWVASHMFRDCFDEKELDEVFLRGVFAEEHDFIDWDGFFYPRPWLHRGY